MQYTPKYQTMEHDVFISYSSRNSQVAEYIYNELQKASIKCWMAPNSLHGGDEYEEIIEQAIRECRALVLVYSEHAVTSRWVNSEVTIAFSEYKHIIPFRIDETPLEGKMKVKLIQSHWINACSGYRSKVGELIQSIQTALNSASEYTEFVANKQSAQELNFVQRFEFEDANELFEDKQNAEAIDMILPLALMGNRESQMLLCKIYFHLTNRSLGANHLRSISPKIKEVISSIASTGEDWANFIMHCYAYKQNDNQASLNYLKVAIETDSIALAYLRLGIVYGYGLGVDVKWSHAMDCYKRAEQLGCNEVYSYLGQIYRWGYDKSQPDIGTSIDYYMKGVEANDWRAIRGLSDLYINEADMLDEATSFLDRLADNDTEGIELLYGDYYRKKYELNKEAGADYLKQAIEFLEIALNKGYFEAYGTLASIYHDENDIDKAMEYAEKGYLHGDSLSYHIIYKIERSRKNYAKAWEVTEERNNIFCIGGGFLGELYIEYGYLPSEKYRPILIKLLQRNATIGGITSCKSLITLYSEERFGMKNSDMEEKYRRMAANIGEAQSKNGVKYILDYAKYLLDKDSSHYNPMSAIKYLKTAVEKKSIEASILLLKQYEGKQDMSFFAKQYNKARSYILKCGAYDINHSSFEGLYKELYNTPMNDENISYLKSFHMKVFLELVDEKHKEIRVESCVCLLKGYDDGKWQLSEEVVASIKTVLIANKNIKTLNL